MTAVQKGELENLSFEILSGQLFDFFKTPVTKVTAPLSS